MGLPAKTSTRQHSAESMLGLLGRDMEQALRAVSAAAPGPVTEMPTDVKPELAAQQESDADCELPVQRLVLQQANRQNRRKGHCLQWLICLEWIQQQIAELDSDARLDLLVQTLALQDQNHRNRRNHQKSLRLQWIGRVLWHLE
jgi:hypothetical protein